RALRRLPPPSLPLDQVRARDGAAEPRGGVAQGGAPPQRRGARHHRVRDHRQGPGRGRAGEGARAPADRVLRLGILLLAAGTVCAHPSPATVCVGLGTAAGVALKIPLEERALRRTLGEAYVRYAARVPALLPRLLRRGRP